MLREARLIISLVTAAELVLVCFSGAASVFTTAYVTPSGVYVKARRSYCLQVLAGLGVSSLPADAI